MKSILMAATLVGVAVAGVILYFKGTPLKERKIGSTNLLKDKVDGHERSMKYSMG
jgi:hypothetical protein